MSRICIKHDFKSCPTPCPECDGNCSEESQLPDVVGTQKSKVEYLVGKGGHVAGMSVYVTMPDGSIAEVSPHGRVSFLNTGDIQAAKPSSCKEVFNDYMESSQEIPGGVYNERNTMKGN